MAGLLNIKMVAQRTYGINASVDFNPNFQYWSYDYWRLDTYSDELQLICANRLSQYVKPLSAYPTNEY